jgi:hypothetical protein
MKLFSLIMIGALAIGCGGNKPKAETTTTDTTKKDTTTTTDGTPCTQEIALQCPDGQIDACLKTPAEGDTHKCVAK